MKRGQERWAAAGRGLYRIVGATSGPRVRPGERSERGVQTGRRGAGAPASLTGT